MSGLQNTVAPRDLVVYADDWYVIVNGEDYESLKENTERVMSKHFQWLDTIGMVCNQTKTELLYFGNDQLRPTVNGELITSKNSIKVLGLIMDHDFKWTSTVSKLRSLTFALRYLRRHLSLSEMKPALFAHVCHDYSSQNEVISASFL